SFRSALRDAEAEVLEAVRWQEYSFTEEWWRGPACGRVIGFEFQDWTAPCEEAGVVFSLLRRHVRSAPAKLKLCCEEETRCLRLSLQYDAALFRVEDMRRLLDQLGTLAMSASGDLDSPLAALEILNEKERQHLLVNFNDAAVQGAAGLSVHALF